MVDKAEGHEQTEKSNANIHDRKDPSLRCVFETAWLVLVLSKKTTMERIQSALLVGGMSLVLVVQSMSVYLFPAMAGNILLVATTQNSDRLQYCKDVSYALAIPLVYSLVMLYVSLQVMYLWYHWKLNLRKDIGDRMHAMLYDCDKQRLVSILDTPDQRITEDLFMFIDAVYSQQGILHMAADSLAFITFGVVVNGMLLGPTMATVIIIYSLMQIWLEYTFGKPLQYILPDLGMKKGVLRANLVNCVSGAPDSKTGEQVTLDTIDGNLMDIYHALSKMVSTRIKLAFVQLTGENLKGYVFQYVVALIPTLLFDQPAPNVASLTQSTMSISLLLNALLRVSAIFETWFEVCGYRNRVQDLYDAMYECRNKTGLYPDVKTLTANDCQMNLI